MTDTVAAGAEVGNRHHEVAGWAGGPGACGIACACGIAYDGCDTLAEASMLLARHIAAAKHRNDGDRGNERWRQLPPPEPNPLPVPHRTPPWPGRRPQSGYRGVHRRPGMPARLLAAVLRGASR